MAFSFFRRMKAKFAGAVARAKLDTSQAADKSQELLQSRPLPSQKGRADLSQGVDDIQLIPALVAGINKDIHNKGSTDCLSPSSTFLSSTVYNSRLNEHDTTDKDFSFSSSPFSNSSQTTQINVDTCLLSNQVQTLTSPAIHSESVREPASVQEEMENWDEAFDFQTTYSHTAGPITSPSTSTSTSATFRHKAHSVSVPIPIPEVYTPHSNSLPANTENWDDSYVYEDEEEEDEENDDISSLGITRPAVPPIFSSRQTGSVEDDVDSWGSGSDWSGDGDIEDLTRDSFRDDTLSSNPGIAAVLEGQLSTTTMETPRAKEMRHSGIPRFGRLTSSKPSSTTNNAPSALTNAAPTKADNEFTRTPSSTSFLSKISPVHRWKSPVRGGESTPKPPQPFQVNRDNNNATPSLKSIAGERNKKELIIRPVKEDSAANKVKKQGSRTPLSPISSTHVHPNTQSQPQRKEKEKDQGKGKNPMSPIKRVFSGTPLSPKNTSPSSGSSKLNNNSSFPTSSQTSSQSSTSISAEMAEHEREIPSRKNPLSAPSSTVTSPMSKQTITAGARNKVRYRSKTTTSSTSTNPNLAPSTSTQPFHTSLAQNIPLSPPNNNGLTPRLLSQTPRRSSLNDLKLRIPERISHAQRDIKRDINDVRDFAACIEQLRSLQHVYAVMLRDLRAVLSEPTDQSSPPQNSISFLNLSPKKRRGTVSSSQTPSISSPSKAQILKRKFSLAAPPSSQPGAYAAALNKLDNSYGIWWECAEVLIALGGWRSNGNGVDVEVDVGSPSGNALVAGMVRGRRVRAVTLGSEAGSTVVGVNVVINVNANANTNSFDNPQGSTQVHGPRPPTASPPKPSQWRATTGRSGNGRDLTPRQLAILQDMLLGQDEREGRWDPRIMDGERGINDANSDDRSSDVKSRNKKGLRDLWSGFRKSGNSSTNDSINPLSTSNFTASPSTSSPTRDSASFDSSASESNRRTQKDPFSPPDSSYDPNTGRPLSPRTPSPSKRTVTAAMSRGKKPIRRPSLAGIFGMGQRIVPSPPKGSSTKHDGSSSDWDLIEIDANDVSARKKPSNDTSSDSASPFKPSTIRGRAMATYESCSSPDKKGSNSQQQQQLRSKKPSLQLPRTPNIFHSSDDASGPRNEGNTLRSPVRIRSEVVHSSGSTSGSGIPVAKLAFTPNNIRPLLKHAQEIASHLNECIGEVRGMMGGMSVI
ncbi:hypothetical protein Clacol_008642 [Clathrus columnatus]|uniref:Uncharacterized protein n=1 Tax=Clathrus columnatus TaxID=1419009 RepID=A0AAV5AMU0_9AGAM|nr:hypothetical protein Clacol_008642 [Clathrus columnatus]